jgi:hypothetical protein
MNALNWITPFWLIVFSIEPFICLATAMYMVCDTSGYLNGLVGPGLDAHALSPLVQQYASVIFSAYVVCLGAMLWTPALHVKERQRCFAMIQTAMLIGDIILVGSTVVSGNEDFVAIATGVMASFWGSLRFQYLTRDLW